MPLSSLSCPRPAVQETGSESDGDGTTVAFWPFVPLVYTLGPLAAVRMDLRKSMGGVWRVKIQHICPRATKTLKGTSQKDRVPAMYSIFIYLFNSPNLYSPQEGFTLSAFALFQQFPS